MEQIPFYLFVIILMMFLLASSVLVYHFSRFALSGERHDIIISVFIIVSLVFVVLEFLLFMNMDWHSIFNFIFEDFNLRINAPDDFLR